MFLINRQKTIPSLLFPRSSSLSIFVLFSIIFGLIRVVVVKLLGFFPSTMFLVIFLYFLFLINDHSRCSLKRLSVAYWNKVVVSYRLIHELIALYYIVSMNSIWVRPFFSLYFLKAARARSEWQFFSRKNSVSTWDQSRELLANLPHPRAVHHLVVEVRFLVDWFVTSGITH